MTLATLRNLAIRAAIAVAMASHMSAARCEDATIMIDNFTFEPAVLTVKVGTSVTWKNRDDIPHTVVSAGKFRSNRSTRTTATRSRSHPLATTSISVRCIRT